MSDEADTGTPPPPPADDPTGGADEASPRPARWRRWTAWTLVVLGTVLLLVASVNIWIKRQALDTDRWVAASGKFIADDEIRAALAGYLVDQLYDNADVSGTVAGAISELAPGSSDEADQPGPVASAVGPIVEVALRQLTFDLAERALASQQVQQLWKEANRIAHTALVALVADEVQVEGLEVEGGVVTLNLQPILANLGSRLGVDVNVDELPADAGKIVILESDELEAAQDAVQAIQKLSVLLILVVLGLFGLAVYLPKGQRRRMVMACAGSLLLIGIVVFVARTIVGEAFVEALADGKLTLDAISAVWGIGTELLVDVATGLIAYGAVLLVAAWVAGPSRPAVAIRRWLAPSFRERPLLVYTAVAALLLLALLWAPTGSVRTLVGTLVLAATILLGVEVLRRQTVREFPGAQAGDPAPAQHAHTP